MTTEFLHRYLREARTSVVSSLDGLSEYDIRRPLVPSGTNLLGLVKHLVGIELGYLGSCVGRPAFTLPWYEDKSVWDNGDMWAKPDESREYLVGLYRQVWAHSDESIASLPLDAPASVSWWSEDRRETTFGHLLVRVVAETAHHAGHCDIVRELIDGRSGADYAEDFYETVQRAAEQMRPDGST
ncbi:DinB family protein [Kibdelosporangium persicum]|uniref:Type I restriction-modification system methyltransferase subunit n=1 Tax=Kibdelosporangium persicum TaxID=2698649 RepID=A0ABX2FDP1_9PSEU|nr:DinB family protein [Kibdelosporangium persicum]NRN69032.1 Type I restriction-modification system methyltransferase subunit [Kibdelosporangium persicum]